MEKERKQKILFSKAGITFYESVCARRLIKPALYVIPSHRYGRRWNRRKKKWNIFFFFQIFVFPVGYPWPNRNSVTEIFGRFARALIELERWLAGVEAGRREYYYRTTTYSSYIWVVSSLIVSHPLQSHLLRFFLSFLFSHLQYFVLAEFTRVEYQT